MTVINRKDINRFKALQTHKTRLESRRDVLTQMYQETNQAYDRAEAIRLQTLAAEGPLNAAKTQLIIDSSNVVFIPSDMNSKNAAARKAARAARNRLKEIEAQTQKINREISTLIDHQQLALNVVNRLGKTKNSILALRNKISATILVVEIELQNYYNT